MWHCLRLHCGKLLSLISSLLVDTGTNFVCHSCGHSVPKVSTLSQIQIVHSPDISNSIASFVEALRRHGHRWEEVHLFLPYNELDYNEGHMLLLHTAFLGPSDASDYTSPVAVPVSFCFNPLSITLPWPQITTLTTPLYDPKPPPLPEKNHLTVFGVSSIVVDPPRPSLSSIRHLLNLRAFGLLPSSGETDSLSMGRLLTALTLPAPESIVMFEPFLGADPLQLSLHAAPVAIRNGPRIWSTPTQTLHRTRCFRRLFAKKLFSGIAPLEEESDTHSNSDYDSDQSG
ncbi:hypothetical protein B0H11DRAFT_2188668 [Mycena galericulata]|nr:hypothetical protein B0H11DRAFT_2188668 [Mycena galericulata]